MVYREKKPFVLIDSKNDQKQPSIRCRYFSLSGLGVLGNVSNSFARSTANSNHNNVFWVADQGGENELCTLSCTGGSTREDKGVAGSAVGIRPADNGQHNVESGRDLLINPLSTYVNPVHERIIEDLKEMPSNLRETSLDLKTWVINIDGTYLCTL